MVEKEHKLHGRNIDPKRANPREPIKKVFVRNLDQNLTENEIREYFGKFGKVSYFSFKGGEGRLECFDFDVTFN